MVAIFQLLVMSGIFKVNNVNLALARATVRVHGKAWLHGCGNVYNNKDDSDFRADFTNPNPDKTPHASSYRLYFDSVNQVPANEDEAEERLLRAKAAELKENTRQKSVNKVRTISIGEDDLHADDLTDKELVGRVVAQKPVTAKGKQVIQTAAQAEAIRANAKAGATAAPAGEPTPEELEAKKQTDGGFSIQDDQPAPAKNAPAAAKANAGTARGSAGVTI